jgi:hypothetical protein
MRDLDEPDRGRAAMLARRCDRLRQLGDSARLITLLDAGQTASLQGSVNRL